MRSGPCKPDRQTDEQHDVKSHRYEGKVSLRTGMNSAWTYGAVVAVRQRPRWTGLGSASRAETATL